MEQAVEKLLNMDKSRVPVKLQLFNWRTDSVPVIVGAKLTPVILGLELKSNWAVAENDTILDRSKTPVSPVLVIAIVAAEPVIVVEENVIPVKFGFCWSWRPKPVINVLNIDKSKTPVMPDE